MNNLELSDIMIDGTKHPSNKRERKCKVCKKKLSLYNTGKYCFSCQKKISILTDDLLTNSMSAKHIKKTESFYKRYGKLPDEVKAGKNRKEPVFVLYQE